MLSFIRPALRPAVAIRHVRPHRQVQSLRALHVSPIGRSKQPARAAAQEEDLFADEDEDDDLFSEALDAGPPPKMTTGAGATAPGPTEEYVHVGNPNRRGPATVPTPVRFNRLYGFMEDVLSGKDKTRKVSKRAWPRLLSLATTEEDLERVVDLMPRWRRQPQGWTPAWGYYLALQCHGKKRPDLTVRVFGDRPKYGVDLSLDAARLVLLSLAERGARADAVAVAALYPLYFLPPASADLSSLAYLLRALLHDVAPATADQTDADRAAIDVARGLLPTLQQLTEQNTLEPERNGGAVDVRVHTANSLVIVREKYAGIGEEMQWLEDWLKSHSEQAQQ
ncbi:uncharacterized protein BXZ73DRAFT_78426 [Epithele typhae]|uniref:uncharacterized protein n=1 Tax=Epithele typhae TaxID=378194 RepID=UPI002008BD98|nr:uncharacterized protein BXZ73DRAFT_78426 [Epithele typhae]KAH9927975.1 hypothetical protein BXZ73DRAFT_78426 [Epithele typhae]